MRVSETISCPLCSREVRERLRLPHTRVYKCRAPDCRLQFAEPQLGDDALADAYRRLYYPPGGTQRPVIENTPHEVISQALRGISERLGPARRGGRLLDYGCGQGELSKIAREHGFLPVGIEQDEEARREIGREGLFPVHPNIEALARQDPQARFDLIVLWNVIEHLRRPWEDLARLRGLLAEGGELVAATPNASGLKAGVLGARWSDYANPTHFYYFTPRSLRAVFAEAGFSPIEEWRLKIVYPHHGRLWRGLHPLLGAARLGGDLFVAGGSGGRRATQTERNRGTGSH